MNRSGRRSVMSVWIKRLRNDRIAAVLIFAATFSVFSASPVRSIFDSQYTMLFSQQLLWNHSFSLEAKAFPELKSRKPGQILQPRIELPYQLYQKGERFYDAYPPGSAVLSIPSVAIANALGVSAIDKNGVHDVRGETRIQRTLAPLLMALFAVIVYFTGRLILSLNWSVLMALATAFGTQVWSNASRAVWSQTWGMVVLGIVVWLLLRAETRKAEPPAILLATCLSWMYFIRHTFSTSIIALTIYVFVYHRAVFVRFMLTGSIWLGAYLTLSEYVFGEPLPPYYHQPGFPYLPSLWIGLAGNLISPSRGLLIYVPILFFIAYLLISYWPGRRPRLLIMAAAIVFAHLIIISLVTGWHGGHCYGPRLSMDVVPWLALLGMLAVKARLLWHDNNPTRDCKLRIRTEWSVAGLLLVCSVVLNCIGAVWLGPWEWNMRPNNIDYNLSRVWDWKHPQFLGVPQGDR